MKKLLLVMMAVIMACGTSFAQQTDYKQLRKERQEIQKMAKKELKARVDRTTRKEAKRLKKEGWQVKPGALPLEKQLERAYLMQYEYDENQFPKYIMGEASSVGENYDAAKVAANSLAVTNLAGNIQTEVTALLENTVANKQLSPEEAASISETVMASKNLISQSIGRTVPVMECFRINSKKNHEVLVRIAYNSEMAKEAAKKAVRDELEKKGNNLHEQLDKALGF
jgi:Ni/Co efflux regulator RcnB